MSFCHEQISTLLISFLTGVAVASIASIDLNFFWFLIGLVLLLPVASFFSENRKIYFICALVLLSFSLGLACYSFSRHQGDLDQYVGRKVEFSAQVVEEPAVGDKNEQLVVQPSGSSALVLLTTDRNQGYSYGDTLRMAGKLELPQSVVAGSSTPFDYQTYLAKDGIYYQMFEPQITGISTRGGNWLVRNLLYLKEAFLTKISTLWPEPESSYLAGLLLGAKQGLGQDINNDFKRAGLSHVLVLSGYNVSLVGIYAAKALAFLPMAIIPLANIIFIVLFGLLAGGGATIWRAVVMAVIAMYAKAIGRLYDLSTTILVTATLMVLAKPAILVFDLSFELSFLALCGVVYGPPVLEKYLPNKIAGSSLANLILTTVSAQIAVAPIILHSMGQVSLISLISNLIILPLVPLTMGVGFVGTTLDFMSKYLAWPVAMFALLLLRGELGLVHFFATLPFAALTNISLPLSAMIFIYLGLVLWMLFASGKRYNKK